MVSQRDATNSARVIMWTFLAVVLMSQMVTVSCRYLPTRSQDDRLEKLRDLLRELMQNPDAGAENFAVESAAGGASFNPHSVMFKRNVPSALSQNQPQPLSNYVQKE